MNEVSEVFVVGHYGCRVHTIPKPVDDGTPESSLRCGRWRRMSAGDKTRSVIWHDWPNVQMHTLIPGHTAVPCIQWFFSATDRPPTIEKQFFQLWLATTHPSWEGDPENFMVAFLGPLSAWKPMEERKRIKEELQVEEDAWIAHLFRKPEHPGLVVRVVLPFSSEHGGLLRPVPYVPPPK